MPHGARLHKILASDPLNSMIHFPNGEHTENGEKMVEVLLRAHFPSSVVKNKNGK